MIVWQHQDVMRSVKAHAAFPCGRILPASNEGGRSQDASTAMMRYLTKNLPPTSQISQLLYNFRRTQDIGFMNSCGFGGSMIVSQHQDVTRSVRAHAAFPCSRILPASE